MIRILKEMGSVRTGEFQLLHGKGEIVPDDAGLKIKFPAPDKRKPGYVVLVSLSELTDFIEAQKDADI
jgi:hypothetical protein